MSLFATIIQDLKNRIGEGIEQALKFLETILSPGSDNYNDYIQVKGRYNSLQRELLLGTIDPATYEKARSGISQALLLLADTLVQDDLKTESAQPAAAEPPKRGEILYRIPDRMQIEHEEKCTVRLAWILEELLRDWEKTDQDVVKDIRMAEIMGVYLLNVDEHNPFAIRTISEPVQFVDPDDFTEWIFYVKPLLVGEFPLVLRVSVIEVINGQERKKDIVLEEQIIVVTEEVPPAENFKKAGESLVVPGNDGVRAAQAPEAGDGPPSNTKAERRTSKWLAIALSTVALATIGVLVGVPWARDEFAWRDARRGGKQPDYQIYLEKHPDGRYRQAALDSLARFDMPRDTMPQSPEVIPSEEPAPPAREDTIDLGSTLTEPPLPPEGKKKQPVKQPAKPTKPSGKVDKSKQNPSSTQTQTQPPPPKPTQPPAGSMPVLTGQVAEFGMPPFSVVRQSGVELQIKFLRFNDAGQSLVQLSGTGGVQLRAGQTLSFLLPQNQTVKVPLAYVATNDNGWLDGYFLLDRAALQQLANNKTASLQLHDAAKNDLRGYTLTDNNRRELKQKAERALRKLSK